MAEFFSSKQLPAATLQNLQDLKASEVIQQSLDLVEFVLHLEERLGLEININTLGEKLITRN
ncbi:MAG: hypothetical protein JO076_17195, partial [Verrucomicrobia bacterium]|nr:hypothetical protein [Verrucomicrobiota bacterium]